jgi:hypothetical protein
VLDVALQTSAVGAYVTPVLFQTYRRPHDDHPRPAQLGNRDGIRTSSEFAAAARGARSRFQPTHYRVAKAAASRRADVDESPRRSIPTPRATNTILLDKAPKLFAPSGPCSSSVHLRLLLDRGLARRALDAGLRSPDGDRAERAGRNAGHREQRFFAPTVRCEVPSRAHADDSPRRRRLLPRPT